MSFYLHAWPVSTTLQQPCSCLTLARGALRGDGEARGTGTGEASHDVVAGMRAGSLKGTLIFI